MSHRVAVGHVDMNDAFAQRVKEVGQLFAVQLHRNSIHAELEGWVGDLLGHPLHRFKIINQVGLVVIRDLKSKLDPRLPGMIHHLMKAFHRTFPGLVKILIHIAPAGAAEYFVRAEDFFRTITATKSFIGADSVDASGGFTVMNPDERTERALLCCAKTRVVIVDHTKFSKGPYVDHLASFADVDLCITDRGISRQHLEMLQSNGVEVMTV